MDSVTRAATQSDDAATDATVTQWIAALKAGESIAAERLWQRYFSKLVALARGKLRANCRLAMDEEDVALSAFKSLCLGAADGRFPQLHDRDNLWPLLVVLTVRKAQDALRRQGRQKRGGSASVESLDAAMNLEALLSHEPTPEMSVMMAENCNRLLGLLDERLRAIALLRLEGHTTAEIAARQSCGLRTIERRLELIRRAWEESERRHLLARSVSEGE